MTNTTPKTIALMGLGAMGQRMGENLLKEGHALTAYNRTAARAEPLLALGATLAATPREAAAGADMVIGMVTDDDASRAVWTHPETGALSALSRGAIAIESSTLTPAWTLELAELVSRAGGAFLDAPVAGTRPQAEAGALIFMVGGDPTGFARAQPILASMGSVVKHVGATGAGATLKLAVNALFGVHVAALAEILVVLERSGFERGPILEALSGMPITSPAVKGVASLMAAGAHAPMFPIALVAKDLRYTEALAESASSEIPITRAARSVYEEAAAVGFAGDNISGVVQLFERV